MTASLHHAQHILAAAINAGFRESGVQSLKNLDDPNAFPMVAIRTAGLALESLIGFLPDPARGEEIEDEYSDNVQSMVSEEYLQLLLKLGNERFDINSERIRRFEKDLFYRKPEPESTWEEPKARKDRMRVEGLKQQKALQQRKSEEENYDPSV